MKPFACAFAVVVLSCSASPVFADCNRVEYGPRTPWLTTCPALGVPFGQAQKTCTEEMLATVKADLDWVLFEDAAALEAYRASVKEQIACGYPPVPLTRFRAVQVAVKAHNPPAQCMLLFCELKINMYMLDLEDQGKLPKD